MKVKQAERLFAVLTCAISVCLILNIVFKTFADAHRDASIDAQNELIESKVALASDSAMVITAAAMVEQRVFSKLNSELSLLPSGLATNEQLKTTLETAFNGMHTEAFIQTINNSAAGTFKAGQKMADSKKRLLYSRSMNRRWSIAADSFIYFGLILNLLSFLPGWSLWQRTLSPGSALDS